MRRPCQLCPTLRPHLVPVKLARVMLRPHPWVHLNLRWCQSPWDPPERVCLGQCSWPTAQGPPGPANVHSFPEFQIQNIPKRTASSWCHYWDLEENKVHSFYYQSKDVAKQNGALSPGDNKTVLTYLYFVSSPCPFLYPTPPSAWLTPRLCLTSRQAISWLWLHSLKLNSRKGHCLKSKPNSFFVPK